MAISLSILFTSVNIEATSAFYEVLGFTCHAEKHGNGPAHFSLASEGEPVTSEIYPKRDGDGLDHNVIIRVETDNIHALLDALRRVCADPNQIAPYIVETSPLIDKVRIHDPDGRVVELVEYKRRKPGLIRVI